jgi:hypothetical protein
MTDLLDLPAEIFQMITHEVVSSSWRDIDHGLYKVDHVWSLRSVCRTFAVEIERDLLSQQPKELYRSSHSVQRLIWKCLSRYITQASRISGNVNEWFLARLQRMANYILEQLDIKDQKQRAGITEQLFAGLGKMVSQYELAHALWCDSGYTCSRVDVHQKHTEIPVQDQLCAALAVGAHGVLADVLMELSGAEKDPLFDVAPIQLALAMNDAKSLDVILRHLESKPSSLQVALTNYPGMFPIQKSIRTALSSDRGTAAQLLLDYHKRNMPRPTRYIYNRWISSSLHADTTAYLHNLRAVLDFKTGGKTRIFRETLLTACAEGSSEDIQEVLKRIGDVDKGTVLNAPIFIAVRSGRVAAVQACLQAGASVELSVASNIGRLGKTDVMITPLKLAIYRHDTSIIDALIKGGATIPHISQWPTHRRVYHVLHKAASELTDVKLPDLRRFRLMSKADIKALQY